MTEAAPDYRVLDLMRVVPQCDKVFNCHGDIIPCELMLNHEGRHYGHIWGEQDGTVMWGDPVEVDTDYEPPF